MIREFENSRPYITNVYPAFGSDITGFEEIIVTFSEPMLEAFGFAPIDNENIEILSFFNDVCWSEDRRQVIFKMQPELAQENKIYGMKLRPQWFHHRTISISMKIAVN